MKNTNIIFTIIAQNYIGFAVTLAQSIKKSNPNVDFCIFFADGIDESVRSLLDRYEIVGIDVTKTNDSELFLNFAFKYEITEYCTAIKPFAISQLFEQGYDTVTYIDPDIFVYDDLQDAVFSKLQNNNIVLTPHICSPIDDDFLPGEQIHLKTGTYNLGFVSVKNSSVGREIVNWWSKKCASLCLNDSASGLFVDQKWTNLIPGMFPDVYISRHLGLNVAYWNLHERNIVGNRVNDEFNLVFFHFSGFVIDDIDSISKYQNRCSLSSRPDLTPLFEEYKERVSTILKELPRLPQYRYNNYTTGKKISLLARRFYMWNEREFVSPFLNKNVESDFLTFLKNNNVKESTTNNSISTPENINKNAKLINAFMCVALRVLGSDRYVSLCKYFGYLSSLQNHDFLIKGRRGKNVVNDSRNHLKR